MNRRGRGSSVMPSETVARRDAKGATSAKRGLFQALRSYVHHHRASLKATFTRLWKDKLQTLMTSLVVAVALALPALLLITLNNLAQLGQAWDTEPKLTLYLNARAKSKAIDDFLSELEQDLRVESLRYISADDALREFEAASGFGSVLEGLDNNPLPAAIEIGLAESFKPAAQQKALAEQWQAHALVDHASVDLQWVQRFVAITMLVRKVVFFLAALLAVGALLVIGNTIRLIIENRKDEIVIIKLVGGTNSFVRRPLLYSGGAYGFVGALIALFIIQFVLAALSPVIEGLALSYQSDFALTGIQFVQSLKLLLIGTFLGWLGAVFAVGRHLSAIEPN